MSALRFALLLVLLAPTAGDAGEMRFTVTSRSLASVTIDGGTAHGLRAGDRLLVVNGQSTVGELEVLSADERWSTCRPRALARPIALGDAVVAPSRSTGPTAPAPKSAPKPPPVAVPEPTPVAVPEPTPSAPAALPAAPPATAPAPAAAPAPVPARAAAPASPAGRKLVVKYRSASSVYLDGGRAAGLEVGDRLRVLAGASTIAELEVAYVAEMSASCRVVSETRPVGAGDVAVVHSAPRAASPPAAAPPPAVEAGAAPAPAEPRPASPWARVRGFASFGYYKSWDETESALDFEERTARVDLTAYDIGGQPLSFTLRGRSRENVRSRTLSQRTPSNERTDRLYEVALRYEPPSDRIGVEVGRIGIHRFVGIGYLDGVLGRFRPVADLQVGVFGGRVADIESLGFDGTGSKYGGFVRLAPGGRYSAGGHDVMLALVRENAEGDVSREYLSLESRFGSGSRWSLFQRAELDLNTGWRKEVTGKGTQLSNVSLSGNLRLASSAWAFVSYDGRRNYRYYRNRVVPEEVFDDLLHQGLRAGVNLSRAGGFGATAGVGMSLKEPDPRHPELDIANAYSGNLGVRHADLFGFSVGLDGTAFSNGYTEGGLVMARLGRRFRAGHLVDLSYGRSLYRVKLTEQDRNTQWVRLVGRGELGRWAYLQSDFEYDTGDDLSGPRLFVEVGVRF